MPATFQNAATMMDAREIMIQEQIQNDRKLTALYQKRAKIRDFDDETRIDNYGGYDETKAYSFAYKFTNRDVSRGTINMTAYTSYQITTLEGAFADCTALETIDLSSLNLDFCTSFKRAFSGCINLRSIKFGHHCTINVTDMSSMFYNCKLLTNIDTGGYAKNQLDWNTDKVIDFSNMFCNCEMLTTLQLDSFNTDAALTVSSMFMNCKRLTSIRVGHWNLSNAMDFSFMFAGCQELKYVDVERWTMADGCPTRFMFYQCESLQYIDCSKWTTQIVDFASMFENCRCLEFIDISNTKITTTFDTTNMCYDCESLVEAKLPPGVMKNNTLMTRMFGNCKALSAVEIVTPLSEDSREFYHNCETMKTITIGDNQLDNVKYMNDMFNGCKNLTILDLSRQNSKPLNITHAFHDCVNLEVLDISGLDLSEADATQAFTNLNSLTILVMKEISGKYCIRGNYVYLDGKRFAMFKNFKRKDGILRIAFSDDVSL